MTTLAGHRSAFGTACAANGVPVRISWQGEPPYAIVFFDGTDFDPATRDGNTNVRFAVVAVVSKASEDAAMDAVDAFVEDVYAAILDTPGWGVTGIDGLVRSTVGADTMYTVTFRCNAFTELGG